MACFVLYLSLRQILHALSLIHAVTLETYKLPDSDEELDEEEAIRRVLKQVRSGTCGLVYLPFNHSWCFFFVCFFFT